MSLKFYLIMVCLILTNVALVRLEFSPIPIKWRTKKHDLRLCFRCCCNTANNSIE